jgi:hypothetical protein
MPIIYIFLDFDSDVTKRYFVYGIVLFPYY